MTVVVPDAEGVTFTSAGPAVAAAPTVTVSAFTLTQVNMEQQRVKPGGRAALCQAIPFTELAPHVRWSRGALKAVVELSAPGHRDRPVRRTLQSAARSGVRRVTFTPASLDDAAFPQGVYVVRVKVGGRTRATARMTPGPSGSRDDDRARTLRAPRTRRRGRP